MKFKFFLIPIGTLLILVISYFIIQSLNKKGSSLLVTSNINSDTNTDELINLNTSTSTNSSEISNINTADMQLQNTNQTGEVDPDAVLFDKAYTAGDRAICDQIKGEPSKLLCDAYIINAKAKSENNIKLCEEITDDFYRTDCHDNVIDFFAKQDKNKEKCNELIDKKRFEECVAGTR